MKKQYNKVLWCENHNLVIYKNKVYIPINIFKENTEEYMVVISDRDEQLKVKLSELELKH